MKALKGSCTPSQRVAALQAQQLEKRLFHNEMYGREPASSRVADSHPHVHLCQKQMKPAYCGLWRAASHVMRE